MYLYTIGVLCLFPFFFFSKIKIRHSKVDKFNSKGKSSTRWDVPIALAAPCNRFFFTRIYLSDPSLFLPKRNRSQKEKCSSSWASRCRSSCKSMLTLTLSSRAVLPILYCTLQLSHIVLYHIPSHSVPFNTNDPRSGQVRTLHNTS